MDVIVECCAGLDVGKDEVAADVMRAHIAARYPSLPGPAERHDEARLDEARPPSRRA